MPDFNKKEEVDFSTLYQVAAERFNVIHQQSQTAISISAVSIMAFAATIGAIFASMGSARDTHRFYADCIIIIVSFMAIATSVTCKGILNRTSETVRLYEALLKQIECKNDFRFKPHQEFYYVWNHVFKHYEPYKMASHLMTISIILYVIVILAAGVNIGYLLIHLKISLIYGPGTP